jgi:hypothetical protein
VVDPLEGRDDLLVVRHHDDGGVVLRAIWLRMRITASARSLSSGAVGSSARITGGRLASARAIDTRCCSPPESCEGWAGAVLHVQRLQQFQRAPRASRWAPGQHGQQGHVVGHVEERDQVGRLEHEADAVAPQRAQVGDLPAVVVDRLPPRSCARRGLDDRAQALQQRALARARRADQAHHLAGGHLHVHVLQRLHGGVALAVALAQALDADAGSAVGAGTSSTDGRAGSTFSAARIASVLASAQITSTATSPATASPGSSSTYFGNAGAQKVAEILPTDEADQAQAQRLLQDHAGDGAVARADQLEHRDLADLAQVMV